MKRHDFVLQIYEALRDKRLPDYRKVDDASDSGYLRTRKLIWDGLTNTKGLRWKGGDHVRALSHACLHPNLDSRLQNHLGLRFGAFCPIVFSEAVAVATVTSC